LSPNLHEEIRGHEANYHSAPADWHVRGGDAELGPVHGARLVREHHHALVPAVALQTPSKHRHRLVEVLDEPLRQLPIRQLLHVAAWAGVRRNAPASDNGLAQCVAGVAMAPFDPAMLGADL
jgi:hypothetical protein